ncbi:hypothetical protein BAY13_16875 [Elizabethkingia bruuniana]|uniref:hypothetical protein n=1 Tax=Elizabethkingia bruuniana TaxID=1756149 RepID=UPI0009D5ABA5|nr:hypothetical protein [Elizabethkingia bruuniana]OPC66412.1 hypothetical protein BAY13_16875 [Elizabethkingia bruuniana]
MTKNLLKASLWGILTLSLFYSCRTDSVATEQTAQVKEKIAAFERFEKENNIIKPIASNDQGTSSAKYVSYSYPFALIIYNFLQTHPDYAKQIEKEVGTIRLDAVSQTFGNTEKSVIFPVTNNEGKVVAIWAGVINENRDYVTFYSLNRNTQEINSIKTAFQNYYDQKERRLSNNAIASTKGLNPIAGAQVPPKDPPVKDKEIPEVVINVPAVPERDIDPWWYIGPGGSNYGNTQGDGMSGGSTTHGGGGGSGGSDTPPAGMVMPPPPKNPINDMKKFLSCLDLSKSANIKVYAENMLPDFPGHAFISIEQGGNRMTFGFYPQDGDINSLAGRGIMGEDGGHKFDAGWDAGTISASKLKEIVDYAQSYVPSRYDLAVRNCSDFAMDILSKLNVSGADSSPNWTSPASVANVLKAQSSGKIPKGNVPENQRTCN